MFDDILAANKDVLTVTGFAAAVLWVFFAAVMFHLERDNPAMIAPDGSPPPPPPPYCCPYPYPYCTLTPSLPSRLALLQLDSRGDVADASQPLGRGPAVRLHPARQGRRPRPASHSVSARHH